jgi:hypothetical protein
MDAERAFAYHVPMRRIGGGGSAVAVAFALSVVGGACSGEPASDASESAAEDSAAAISQELPPPPDSNDPQPVTLEAVNQSGVEGRAIAIDKADSVQFNLMVQGLPGAGEYAAHIHTGNCQAGGAVLIALNPVRAESDGMGRSMTTLAAGRLAGEGTRFVQVHGARGVLACGDVHRSGSAGPVSPP